jgi:hypothetical protein
MRSPARTGSPSDTAPLRVTVLPTRPDMAASMALPKPDAICVSDLSRQSVSIQSTSRSTATDSGPSTIRAPAMPRPSCCRPPACGWYQNVPASGGVNS